MQVMILPVLSNVVFNNAIEYFEKSNNINNIFYICLS